MSGCSGAAAGHQQLRRLIVDTHDWRRSSVIDSIHVNQTPTTEQQVQRGHTPLLLLLLLLYKVCLLISPSHLETSRIMSAEWKNGLFGCFSNCGTCLITYFVPCYTAGKVAEAVGKSCCLWGCLSTCGPIGLYTMTVVRGLIREQQGIAGTCCQDLLITWFCGLCALVQEQTEVEGGLKSGGAAPSSQEQAMSRE